MMFQYLSTTITDYTEYKAKLDAALQGTANGMVQVGFLLAKARDTNILEGSGYSGMGAFALKEYGLTPDQTSRFIAISDRYGDGEGRLQEKWQDYGYSKLSEMLSLPDNVVEAIPPEITREEIRELKAEIKAEQEITPLEVAMEEPPEEESVIAQFLRAFFRSHPWEFTAYYDKVGEIKDNITKSTAMRATLDALAASGVGILEARIPQKGRFMLSFKGEEHDPVLVDIRNGDNTDCQWSEVVYGMIDLAGTDSDAKSRWSEIYGEVFPDKSEEKEAEKSQNPKKEPKTQKKAEKKVKIAPAQMESKEKEEKREEKEEKSDFESAMNPPEEEKEAESDTRAAGDRKFTNREIERVADGLRSIADEFSSGKHTVYDCYYQELLGLKDEIKGLPDQLIPMIEDAIRIKEQ